MPATIEIDNAVLCEKVLGWKRDPVFSSLWFRPEGGPACAKGTLDFLHDISAAWMLVEALPGTILVEIRLDPARYWHVHLTHIEKDDFFYTGMGRKCVSAITKAVWALVQEKGGVT